MRLGVIFMLLIAGCSGSLEREIKCSATCADCNAKSIELKCDGSRTDKVEETEKG